jgi:hypothetical protein
VASTLTAFPQASTMVAGRLMRRSGAALLWCAPPLLAGLGAALPILDSTLKAVRAGWMPAGDDGIIATRAYDVLSSHTPLVGQYSEAGLVIHGQVMHSPGPMLYWLLALPARFGAVSSLPVTMGAVNTLAVVGCVMLARRRGGLVLMLGAALAVALMCRSLGGEVFHDVWNPSAALFPFLLLVFLGWSLACGDAWLLPPTVLVASYVLQTHLMYAAPTVVVLAVGLGGLAVGRRRTWPWALVALVLAAGCWTAPAIEQIEDSPGNMTMILRTAEHRGHALGARVGWHAVVESIGVTPWWLRVPASEWQRKREVLQTPPTKTTLSTILALAALALMAIVGLGTRRRDLAAAALIGLGLSAAIGLEAATNPSTPLLAETLGYTMWWGSELGLWVWLVLAWGLWLGAAALLRVVRAAMSERLRVPAGAARGAVAAMALVGIGGIAWAGAAAAGVVQPDSHVYDYRPIAAIAAGIERVVPAHVTVGYGFGDLDTTTQPMEPAIRFLLVRHGDRPLAQGSLPRLGSYYEPYRRPVQWKVYLSGSPRPVRNMRLVARVRFAGPWGSEQLSAWSGRIRPRVNSARAQRPPSARPRDART